MAPKTFLVLPDPGTLSLREYFLQTLLNNKNRSSNCLLENIIAKIPPSFPSDKQSHCTADKPLRAFTNEFYSCQIILKGTSPYPTNQPQMIPYKLESPILFSNESGGLLGLENPSFPSLSIKKEEKLQIAERLSKAFTIGHDIWGPSISLIEEKSKAVRLMRHLFTK